MKPEPVEILYGTLIFAERIGGGVYTQISSGNPYVDLAGEWVFSNALFDGGNPQHAHYIDDVLRRQSSLNRRKARVPEAYINTLVSVLPHVEPFLDQITQLVLDRNPQIVGFTSTFQQHVASLCLARRLKAARPDLFIVMGGGNCEGMMGIETIRQFEAVDAVVSGEGEIVFPELVRLVRDGRPIDHLPGVFTRSNIDQPFHSAPMTQDLDNLPLVNYDDYFDQLDRSAVPRAKNTRILFETSRGCWWGERSHCTFCGLNGETLAYRSKSAERAASELEHLLSSYPDLPVWIVDNILDMRYFNDFIPHLGQLNLDLELFYEVKANLRKTQIAALRQAGVRYLQPGIESLSDHVLTLMKKGVSWLQNVQLLKWGKEQDMIVYWNILWGFPGERPEDYEEMVAVLPLLHHLNPPISMSQIRLDRFSPYFDDAEAFGFAAVRPAIPYEYIYALPADARANLAYHFFYDYQEPRDVNAYTQPLFNAVKVWRQVYDETDLILVDLGSHTLIWDLRSGAAQALTVLSGAQRDIYLACDQIRTLRQVQALVPPNTDLDPLLEPLIERGLMLRSGSKLLSLALQLGRYTPTLDVLQRLRDVAAEQDIVQDRNTELDAFRLDNGFFALSADGVPVVRTGALDALIDRLIIAELTVPCNQTLGGITIDM